MSFKQKLEKCIEHNDSLVCVGIDPDLRQVPLHIAKHKEPFFEFFREILEVVAPHICALKFQFAYYGAEAREAELKKSIEHSKKKFPEIPVILDAKRGDIDQTSKAYAREAFERYEVDALTVNPYLGFETLQPFFDYRDRGVIILCKTSNGGSGEFQNLEIQGETVFERVAKRAKEYLPVNENIALVVGATQPRDLERVRRIVGDMPLLLPGFGVQGANVEDCVRLGQDAQGKGLVMSASRSIIYASSGEDFAEASEAAVRDLKVKINRVRFIASSVT